MPIHKYRHSLDSNPVSLPDRTWPNNRITHAPRWLSTDLRDGNQALIEPMNPAQKREMFDLLVRMGFKEIEVGFPAASETDWDFVRSLAEDDAVPPDVTISVLTQSRTEIIHRTIDSLAGFPRATVHLYNATSPTFRKVVFNNDKAQTKQLAVAGTQDVTSYMEKVLGDDTIAGFQYSPEIFVDTELDFALEVCEAVMDVWQPDAEREIIINLPTTVERTTPNVYADQIEYMSRNLSRREYIALSAHNHNDRGTGIATAELAMLAGADRVEGCLFGQGERTGNVDLVTIALNLFSQGIDPELDVSHIDDIRRIVEHCTQMEVPARQPYSGDLVYTSFSGSHQDAIKKGFAARAKAVEAAGGDENAVVWDVPYLPIDPKDVGRSYEAVVRVNSQSGKGGIAYLMSEYHGMDLPRRLQIELSGIVQRFTDTTGGEVSAEQLWMIFADEYLPHTAASGLTPWGKYSLKGSTLTSGHEGEDSRLTITITERDAFGVETDRDVTTLGNGPIDAFVGGLHELGLDVHVLDYVEHAMASGRDAVAASYVECEVDGQILWGVGMDPSTMRASFKAIISAVNRALR
ncbi:MAG: 2-isopropylmalate synthase [Actinomycetaceae bacterium]|nr:2-isopropylmalate synthase [Arcanobacterium sp.]MDD7505387.1 2-isopropylmalate synthase [Actinomycetaceae bacterium]MDY6142931.1 2-isopropylmalate synthase [Arcanobacterium sp.]